MVPAYQRTRLWSSAFAHSAEDEFDVAKSRLSAAYHSLRERAILLAGEIPQDLREFTRHDATHLDALWDMGDLVVGSSVELNPLETYILGSSFLIHDLGMGIAALPTGLDGLRSEAGWLDIVASTFRDVLDVVATPEELNDPPIELLDIAIRTALREKHAERAKELAFTSWPAAASSDIYYLIEDVELRSKYGHLIGTIAASHGWNLDRVVAEMSGELLGSSGSFPPEWTVDPLKLACIMRLADACHIDDRRAPGFLRAVRRPSAGSDEHWVFQTHLNRPYAESDFIVYTAAQPFAVAEAAAWWLCFETIQAIDRELANVDALLLHKGRQRMAIRRVRGADSPWRLAEIIPATDWTPVDARVVVSNVPKLVRSLGGENLYGEDLAAPLRELIQNGTDACRALQHLVADCPPPTIHVKVKQEHGGDWWLTVTDNGIGMSQTVMASVLLDFGHTFWGSELMRREVPGLAASSFRSTGKFGIGFYSVFMLGDEVKVVSRRFDGASSDTRVLEFEGGVSARPILRPARRDEMRYSGGTSISVRLREPFRAPDGLLGGDTWHTEGLDRYCAWLAPTLDADLVVQEGDASEVIAVRAGDWLTLEAKELLLRIHSARTYEAGRWSVYSLTEIADAVITIEEDGEVVGRATLPPDLDAVADDGTAIFLPGVATAGGLRLAEVSHVCGVLLAYPVRADRASGRIIASEPIIRDWASRQLRLCGHMSREAPSLWMIEGPAMLARFGIDTGSVLICGVNGEFLDAAGLRRWAEGHSEIVAASLDELDVIERQNYKFECWDKSSHQRLKLNPNTVVVPSDTGYGGIELVDPYPDKAWRPTRTVRLRSVPTPSPQVWWYFNQRTPNGLILRCIMEAWSCTLTELVGNLEVLQMSDRVTIGERANKRGPQVQTFAEWRVVRPSPTDLTPGD